MQQKKPGAGVFDETATKFTVFVFTSTKAVQLVIGTSISIRILVAVVPKMRV